MLSTQYRLRLESICDQIAKGKDVKLEDMIWAQKLAKSKNLKGKPGWGKITVLRTKVLYSEVASTSDDNVLKLHPIPSIIIF